MGPNPESGVGRASSGLLWGKRFLERVERGLGYVRPYCTCEERTCFVACIFVLAFYAVGIERVGEMGEGKGDAPARKCVIYMAFVRGLMRSCSDARIPHACRRGTRRSELHRQVSFRVVTNSVLGAGMYVSDFREVGWVPVLSCPRLKMW